MRAKFAKIAGSTIALLALASIGILGTRAQQTGGNSTSSAVTTNWLGYLVVGVENLGFSDPMPGTTGPHPTMVPRVQIGLRSDGVVIWREATMPK